MPIMSPRPRTSPTFLNRLGQSRSRSRMWPPTSAAFAINSLSRSSMVASAAATATGFPPKVDACEPGGQSMMSARAIMALSGSPLAMPFALVKISGATPKCSADHILPVRPMPHCTSSKMSRIPGDRPDDAAPGGRLWVEPGSHLRPGAAPRRWLPPLLPAGRSGIVRLR